MKYPPVLLLALLLPLWLFGCGGSALEVSNADEMAEGPGVFSAEEGGAVLYRSESQSASATPENMPDAAVKAATEVDDFEDFKRWQQWKLAPETAADREEFQQWQEYQRYKRKKQEG